MMANDSTRLALQTRLGWYGLAQQQGLIPRPTTPPAPPRSAAEALYPRLAQAEATRKETSR